MNAFLVDNIIYHEAPSLECTFIRMTQSFGLRVNFINSFELKIVELDLIIREIG